MVMMLVASCVNAQSNKRRSVQKDNMYAIKQAALNGLKRSLVAPSQFILTDYNGNRIGVNGIEVLKHVKGSESKEWSDSVYFYNGNKWSFRDKFDDEEPDSIWVYKVVQEPTFSYYVVRIIGDERNRFGGYEQIIEDVYVYGEASGFLGTVNELKPDVKKYHVETIVCEKRVKEEKTVKETNEEIERLRNEICGHGDFQVYNRNGENVSKEYKEGKAGIYIVNGKKCVMTNSTSDKNDKVKKSKLNKRSNDDVYTIY